MKLNISIHFAVVVKITLSYKNPTYIHRAPELSSRSTMKGTQRDLLTYPLFIYRNNDFIYRQLVGINQTYNPTDIKQTLEPMNERNMYFRFPQDIK